MEACGINPDTNRRLRTVNFYTSHEALLLPFEEAMTRVDSTTGEYHDTSAHFVWIGDRTRQPDGAHVEFCRGIKNPLGIKCGPTLKAEDLINLCSKINPSIVSSRMRRPLFEQGEYLMLCPACGPRSIFDNSANEPRYWPSKRARAFN